MKMVNVRPKHIKTGVRQSNCSCPIAKALYEQFPEGQWRVGIINIMDRATNTYYRLPIKAQQFVDKFDHFRNVTPIKFELRKIKDVV